MGLMKKKKLAVAAERREEELHYLLNSFASELQETEKKLENLAYQIEFFGATPELTEKKQDAKILINWITDQFEDIQKSQFA
ncbi:MAG: hypothetical protein ACTSRK_13145 [Promethearchaeota archaeon]